MSDLLFRSPFAASLLLIVVAYQTAVSAITLPDPRYWTPAIPVACVLAAFAVAGHPRGRLAPGEGHR